MFVQIISEIAAQRQINDAQLARMAWPHQKSAATAWRKMRNDDENPKRLNIEEAVLLTQALGVSMSDVCGMVQGRLMKIDVPAEFPPSEKGKALTGHTEKQGVSGHSVLQNQTVA
ncbi:MULTISPECIES: hypothetical protein [unclassified Desulfovibrio]|uniref:hypothetical protein n=1 Tax=unclassified Desulfovibrio TaxID=2593640 RepID=UPI0013EC707A|nr:MULTISPECIES: hypothetical protein [unclassified Desulfovibrio]